MFIKRLLFLQLLKPVANGLLPVIALAWKVAGEMFHVRGRSANSRARRDQPSQAAGQKQRLLM
jgi:hypothetical protein